MSGRPAGLFLNRELSWLDFNARVLEEARDPHTPLLERLRFLCIYHGNRDEFFMVRVASLLHAIDEGIDEPDPSGLPPRAQLEQVIERVRQLDDAAARLYHDELLPALAGEGIVILGPEALTPPHQRHLDGTFAREIGPILTPLAIEREQVTPHLVGLPLNLAVLVCRAGAGNEETRFALVPMPLRLPGLCRLPGGAGLALCWLADVIRPRLDSLFPGYRIVEASAFRIVRDAEMDLEEERGGDFVQALESGLKKRRRARPIRIEHEERMSERLCERLREELGAPDCDMVAVRGPIDPKALMALVDLPGHERLRYKPQPPLPPLELEDRRPIFDVIRERDLLLHHPYESFDPVVAFLEAAAADGDVLAIKQTLYRTGGAESPVVRALLRAAERGKQVTVLIELTARFDEERNIEWARDLEDAGAQVIYGLAGLKVHAKIGLVVRREPGGIRRYVHLGTGNYNERTARVYTDFGLLTAADDFGIDASGFFNTITGYSEPPGFRRLVMAPTALRNALVGLIRREADRARSGQTSGILAKMNALVDPQIIEELHAASRTGVPIDLIVRGVCCLRPGVSGLSETIRVISVVDRYLEHSRAFVFRNGGDLEVFLSSADWMPRNLDRRVELMFPVLDEELRRRVVDALETQLADTVKARQLGPDGTYRRVRPAAAPPLRSQEHLYAEALAERERARAVTPVRFVPIRAE